MKFTFGVLMYNQFNFIIETLESIKYQIKQYGNNGQINIIFIDDFSIDGTIDIVEKWLQINSDIFENIDFIKKLRGAKRRIFLLICQVFLAKKVVEFL